MKLVIILKYISILFKENMHIDRIYNVYSTTWLNQVGTNARARTQFTAELHTK